MIDNAGKRISRIAKSVESCRVGHPLFFFERISSTNDELKKVAHLGATEGTVVWAEEQIAGRGRMGKSWLSKKGMGLYVSILLRPDWTFAEASFLPMLAALSVVRVLESLKLRDIKIKWPNDVELKNKKIAGVLTENCYQGGRIVFCVMGIGINVLHKESDFYGMEYNKVPTSLLMEGVKTSVDDVLIKLLQTIDALYMRALHTGIEQIIEDAAGYRAFP